MMEVLYKSINGMRLFFVRCLLKKVLVVELVG